MLKKILLLSLLIIFGVTTSVVWAGNNYEEEMWLKADHTSDATYFYGIWRELPEPQAYGNVEKVERRKSGYVEFDFTGTAVRWLGSRGIARGKADVYLDGEKITTVDTYGEEEKFQQVLFTKKNLEPGTHTLRIDPTNTKNENATYEGVSVDVFEYIPTIDTIIEKAKTKLYEAPHRPQQVGDSLVPYYTSDSVDFLIEEIAKGLLAKEKDEVTDKVLAGLIKAISEFEKESISPVFSDLSGNENHGKLRGETVWTEGKIEKAVKFDGETVSINIGNSEELQIAGSQTIELWIKTPGIDPARRNPIHKAYGGEGTITEESEGNVWLNSYWGTGGGNAKPYQTFATNMKADEVVLDKWYHIALVRDLEEGKLYWYINGELDRELEAEYEKAEPSNLDWIIGDGYVDPYKGLIDEVRIWNIARSQDEIKKNMNQKLSDDEKGLVGYWSFDELE